MIAQIILPALLLGFLGSFHCVGMCGPIALSLPVQHLNGIQKVLGILFYNFGRVITYAFLGFIFGIIGKTFAFFGTQQLLSIVLGLLLVLAAIFAIFHKRLFKNPKWQAGWNKLITQKMLPFFKKKNPFFLIILGLLNGLLPCGLVYLAIAGAVSFSSATDAALFMASFGLGTLPAMAALSFAGGIMSLSLRNKVKKLTPYIMGLMGLLLVLRGLNLNIPYLSPVLKKDKVECCSTPE